ncbi:amidohydrolase [Roseibium aquae]|uniref:Amidohydrolase n=1 Tax=Roseibium aquae TaxID=1323746 RepID=A0A916TNA2_9HYPH|nr:carbon-nitrogen hydrolase family protein [Roseibium aquae]GGB61460.1 amidohydrolase [Roseibium aquae]
MQEFVAACVQLRSGRSVEENLDVAERLICSAAEKGARYIQTPEMTNVLVRSREELFDRIAPEEDDPFVRAFARLAKRLGIYLHAGSLAIRAGEARAVNRAFVFGPGGETLARYDKIHMFDVDLPDGESWRESATYNPGECAILVDLPLMKLGLGICYDVRFPDLFRAQALHGAQVLTAPAAFTRQTGKAHWHVLQRARAIENGAFMISAAQGGQHEDGRQTFGHSVIVDPWGQICAECDNGEPGFITAAIDLKMVGKARRSIPNLSNTRPFTMKNVAVARPEELTS